MIYQMTTFTTQYSPAEDRLVLLAKLADGGHTKLLLTRRLIMLLLPKLDAVLLKYYEQEASRPVEHLAAESVSTQKSQAKMASGQAKTPVTLPAETESVLIAGASIHSAETGLVLAMSTEGGDAKSEFRVALTFENLHAWLNIVRALGEKVDWQLQKTVSSASEVLVSDEKPKAGWH